ncbi:hypothetical protein BJV74DRAFT_887351 [Russula compacta]|nr:hypothetical protein BJV74DRAFT_887351 [Russula compacta]
MAKRPFLDTNVLMNATMLQEGMGVLRVDQNTELIDAHRSSSPTYRRAGLAPRIQTSITYHLTKDIKPEFEIVQICIGPSLLTYPPTPSYSHATLYCEIKGGRSTDEMADAPPQHEDRFPGNAFLAEIVPWDATAPLVLHHAQPPPFVTLSPISNSLY